METPPLTTHRNPLFDVVKALMMLWVFWGIWVCGESLFRNPIP